MSKEFDIPQTLDIDLLAKKLQERMAPAQQSTALSESKSSPAFDYRVKLVEMLKNPNQGFKWTGENKQAENQFFESIGALSAGSAIPEIWATEVFRCCPYPASAFYGAPYIKWHDDIKGKPGDTIHVITVGRPVGGTAGCAEPVGTASTISAVAITLEEWQCSMYVCRDDLEDMVPDTITQLNDALVECLDIIIDRQFIINISGHGGTLVGGTAYITPGIIAEAMGTMRAGTCEPVVLIIHPAVESRLMRDSQFVNAATYGDRSVITGGHIIKYLGLDIVVVPQGSLSPDAPGTYASLMLSRYAVHAAKKRDPTIESQYLVQTQRKYVYASVRFGKSVVCNDGVLWIHTGA
ncbi:hypothetical protein MUP59_02475 [Candidatus Bathyarchaeota archaeon]|nr:hypothetical protein [Candidatus Bathyarchaeota archaeon]